MLGLVATRKLCNCPNGDAYEAEYGARKRTMNTTHTLKRMIAGALLSCGVAVAGLGLGTGTAHAYTYGPFQWCPGQAMPNDPPRSDTDLIWDMSVCHTYYFDYDVRTNAPAHYWEGPTYFPLQFRRLRRLRIRRTYLSSAPASYPSSTACPACNH
jgi:hypothetical protein